MKFELDDFIIERCFAVVELADLPWLLRTDLDEEEDGWGHTHHNIKAQNTIL